MTEEGNVKGEKKNYITKVGYYHIGELFLGKHKEINLHVTGTSVEWLMTHSVEKCSGKRNNC